MTLYSIIRHASQKQNIKQIPRNVLSSLEIPRGQIAYSERAGVYNHKNGFRLSVTHRRFQSVNFSTSKGISDSSMSPDEANNDESLETVAEMIRDKDNFPIGSLTPERLIDAEEALLSWANARDRGSFEKALEVLLRLGDEKDFLDRKRAAAQDISSDDEQTPYEVRKILINRVVDCWRTCWRDELVDMPPQEILGVVEKLEAQGVMPDVRTLTLIVDGLTLRGDPLEAPLLAQWILDRRIGQGFSEDADMRPDAVFITTIIRAWAKSGRLEAPEMAEGLLQLMHQYNESNGWYECAPNTLTYTAVLEAWYRSRNQDACKAMQKLLDEMKTSSVKQVIPDRLTYSYVLNCWANSKDPSGPHKAHNLLMEMFQLYDEGGNNLVAPETADFSKVMYSLARRGKIDKVQELFDRLQSLYATTGDSRFEPDDNCWKAILVASTKAGNVAEADDILNEFSSRALQDPTYSILRRSYFVDVLVAWTKQKNKKVGSERAQKLLMTMLELSKFGYPELMPDSKSFEKVILSWANSRDKDAAKHIQVLLSTMQNAYEETGKESIKPTAKAFEMALTCWSRSDETNAPERAQGIFLEMERRYASGDDSMQPTRGAYTTLMLTWLRSRRKNAHSEMQRIVDKVQKRYDEGKTTAKPDVFMYNILLDSWAQRGEAQNAQALFDKMVESWRKGNRQARPDVKAFNTLLKAWGASADRNRAHTAERLFKSTTTTSGNSGLTLTPDRQTFNEMIVVWAKSGDDNAAEKAEHYLNQLKENDFEPTLLSYRAAIDAWTRSKSHDATARAEVLLEDLLGDIESRRVRLPFFKPYMKFLDSIARSRIPGRNEQAKKLLKSLRQGEVPKQLLPPL
jgi:hypothetical protein